MILIIKRETMEENKIQFIDRTIQHIRRVQDNMALLEKNRGKLPFQVDKWRLMQRSCHHDTTKFSNQLVEGYVLITEFYRNERLGLPNDHIDREKLKEFSKIHCELETHHPHEQKTMGNVCLCEMCCDIVAMAQEKGEEDFTKYYKEVQLKNYPILEQYNEEILGTLTLLETLNKDK